MNMAVICGYVERETDKAVLMEDGIVVPKSQIFRRDSEPDGDTNGDRIEYLEVPEWLMKTIADEHGSCPVTDHVFPSTLG